MRRRLGPTALLLLAPVVAAPVAAAQSFSSSASRPFAPPKRGLLAGTVAKAETFELEKGRNEGAERFSIVVIEGASQTEPFPLEDQRAEVAPFTPTCPKYFAVFSGPSADDVKKLVGKTVKGAVSLGPVEKDTEKENKSECVVVDGLDQVIAGAKRVTFGLWRLADTPSNHDQLERARGLFEPDVSEVRFYDQTPLDSAIEYALRDMKSREALELALRFRMYFAISLNSTWRNDPAAYSAFERTLLDTTWPRDRPHPYLAQLFWHASSTKARAKVEELTASRPAFVAGILEENVGWLNATPLYEELVDAKTIPFGAPSDLLLLGTEDAFLERHRTDSPSSTHDVDSALDAYKERRAGGFDDGWSLVRWVAKNKKVPRLHHMRVSLTGTRASCCDLRAMISDDVDLEVRVDCDAEQQRAYCGAKDAAPTRTATGVVKTVQYSGHRFKPGAPERPIVRVELVTATVADGGVIPEPSSLDDAAPAPSAAAPSAPAPSTGCGCVASGEPAGSAACALAVAAICAVGAKVRRRRHAAKLAPTRF